MTIGPWVSVASILAVLGLLWRGAEVRLVLLLGALPMFLATRTTLDFLGTMAREMANPATILPICSSLGFAYVLRLTGCDEHLVHLLVRPLRSSRVFLVPGGIAAGYLVNTTIVSQTGAAAVLGPILIPLLRAGGANEVLAGATLLLGCSMGGELFNPGAVEIRTLASQTGHSSVEVIRAIRPLNLLATAATIGVFWWMARRRETAEVSRETQARDRPEFRVNVFRALVPLLPIALLFIEPWVASRMGRSHLLILPETKFAKGLSEPATILLAMLIGAAVAGLSAPRNAKRLAAEFFEGAGYAYTHVISLIVVAMVFAEGLKATGVIDTSIRLLLGYRPLAIVAAWTSAWFFAVICGSGIAPAVAVITVLTREAAEVGLNPVTLGGLTAMGAHYGRTMSPAAAVVFMSARLSGASPRALIGAVAPSLLAGGAALLAAYLLGIV